MSKEITTELVKELRDQTGISVMQCRKALEEAGGDMDKALAILKKNSSDVALKKMSREVKDGAVTIKEGGDKAVLVSLHCETDFVARNEDFVAVLEKLAELALHSGVEKAKEAAPELLNALIQKTGENIQLGEIYEVTGSVLGSYVHNRKSAVVVSLEGGNTEVAKDIAMHVTAMKPEYITEAEITAEAKT